MLKTKKQQSDFEMTDELNKAFSRYQKLAESKDIADEDKITALGDWILAQLELQRKALKTDDC